MDANQSVQDGREGGAEDVVEDVVEDGEGGESYWRGGEGSVVVEGGREGVFDGAVVGGGDGAVALARHNDPSLNRKMRDLKRVRNREKIAEQKQLSTNLTGRRYTTTNQTMKMMRMMTMTMTV